MKKNNSKKTTTFLFENSKNILSATYDPFMEVLTLNFVHGGEYDYIAVKEDVFLKMQEAESAGRFFHANIRGKYEFLNRTNKKKKKKKIVKDPTGLQ